MKPYHRVERELLSNLLLEAGPTAPTLCEGWTAADLAAHLVLREGRPLSAPGIWLRALEARAERARLEIRDSTPWPDLVERVRHGPPLFSPMRIPAFDAAANTVEFFIHHEDVRRAQPNWEPRQLDAELEESLWSRRGVTRLVFSRRSPFGVVLRWPGHPEFVAKRSAPRLVVEGPPSELLLYASGRVRAAKVLLSGDPEAMRQAAS